MTTIPAADGALTALSCPTKTACFAAGQLSASKGAAASTTNGGKTWKKLTLPSTAKPLDTISCPTATTCLAAMPPSSGATMFVTTNAGSSWSAKALPAGVTGLISLSCPTAAVCVGTPGDGSAVYSTNGGTSWTRRAPSQPGQSGVGAAGGVYHNQLSCATTSFCETGPNVTTPSPALGSVWHSITVGGFAAGSWIFNGASCPGASTCFLTGGNLSALYNAVGAFAVTKSGASVTVSNLATGATRAGPIACASETTCEAFANTNTPAVYYTANGGTSWASSTLPSQAESIAAASCPALGTCLAVGPASSGTAVVGFTGTGAPSVGGVVPTGGSTAGGTAVTVFGSGFASGAAVDFGTKAATAVKVLSAHALTAVAPAGAAGNDAVSVHETTGVSSADPDSTYAYVSSAPAVTGLAPAKRAAYGYSQVTVRGTGLATTTGVKFGTASARWWKVTSATALVAIAPPGTGTVDLRVTTAGGTSAAVTADRFTYSSSSALSFTTGQTLGAAPTPTAVACGRLRCASPPGTAAS